MREFFELQKDFNFRLDDGRLIPTFKDNKQKKLTQDQIDKFNTVKKYSTSVKSYFNNPPQTYSQVVGVDIETTGLDCFKDRIRLIAVYGNNFNYVGDNLQEVEEILTDNSILKVFHNAIFDVSFLKVANIEVVNYTDTLVMSQIIENYVVFDTLDYLVKKYLNVSLDKRLQHGDNWLGELTPKHFEYCLKDAEITLKLFRVLYDLIINQYLFPTYQTEIGTLPCIVELRTNGMMLDKDEMKTFLSNVEEEIKDLSGLLQVKLNGINLNSHMELLSTLQQWGIPLKNVQEETLKQYAAHYPIINDLVQYKKLNKMRSTFGEKLLSRLSSDSRIRGNWNLIGTSTSRMSCSGPNFQGLPGDVKKHFKAKDDHVFIIIDYSTIELRILAELSGCEKLIDSFNKGMDLHTETAKAILGKKNISSNERKVGKETNFGLNYGLTAYGLRNKINSIPEFNISEHEATNFIDAYFNTYTGVARFRKQLLQSKMVTTLGGRYWGPTNGINKLRPRQRLNYTIQASCAEGLKEALILLMKYKKDTWKIVNVIHDEVICEVPEEDAYEAREVIEQIMIDGMQRLVKRVPIEVDSHITKFWTK